MCVTGEMISGYRYIYVYQLAGPGEKVLTIRRDDCLLFSGRNKMRGYMI